MLGIATFAQSTFAGLNKLDYVDSVSEQVILTDYQFARGWFKINNNQTVTWGNINNNQSITWTNVNDTQNPNWVNINDNQ